MDELPWILGQEEEQIVVMPGPHLSHRNCRFRSKLAQADVCRIYSKLAIVMIQLAIVFRSIFEDMDLHWYFVASILCSFLIPPT